MSYKSKILFRIFLIITSLCLITCAQKEIIENKLVTRKIDLTAFIAKENVNITFSNNGDAEVLFYKYEIQEQFENSFYLEFTNNQGLVLDYTIQKNKKLDGFFVKVELDRPVLKNQMYILCVRIIYTNKLILLTKKLTQDEKYYYLMWKGNLMFYSPYSTKSYNIKFSLSRASVVEEVLPEIKVHPITSDSTATEFEFGRFNSHKENSLKYIYSNTKPWFVGVYLKRKISVSHFGRINVEDSVCIRNNGPKLLGPFENKVLDYSFYKKMLVTHLPPSADNIKLFDNIGNNSKSSVVASSNEKTLIFLPRFNLLFGGWKSEYTIQYTLPLYEYLYFEKDSYFLKIRAMDHVLDDIVIEDVSVDIFLPDGAEILDKNIPKYFTDNGLKIVNKALGFFGRPCLELYGHFLLDDHVNDVGVYYKYNWYYIFTPGLVLSAYVYIIFVASIFYKRYTNCDYQ